MTAIAHAFAEQNSNQTTQSASYVDITGVSIASSNFTAGKKYLLWVTSRLSTDSGAELAGMRLAHGGTAFADSEYQLNLTSASNSCAYPWFVVWTAVSGEAITLQFARVTGTTSTVSADQVALFAMNLSDDVQENTDWLYAESTGDLSLTTTFQDGASVTFTPGTASQDWLVATVARIVHTTTTNNARSRIDRSGEAASSLPESGKEVDGTTSAGDIYTNIRVFNLGAASNTFKEQAASTGANAHTRLYSAIFVLNLNKFKNHANAYTEADQNLSATNYATQLQTISITPDVASDVLIGAWFGFDCGNASRDAEFRVQLDNSDQPAGQTTDNYQYDAGSDATDEEAMALITMPNLSAAAHTIDLDASADATTGTPVGQYATLFAFTMELAAAGGGGPAPEPETGQPFDRRFWGIPGHAGYSAGVHN